MTQTLHDVTEWLLSASSEVAQEYFQLPVAGTEEPEYRERVYCYELYHRWRSSWPTPYPFALSGEIDKAGHPLIRNSPKPDFLVHIPGQMTNLLIVEVKPGNADVSRMVDDLVKLTTFRRGLELADGTPGNYDAAYFWIYGIDDNGWKTLKPALIRQSEARATVDLRLITCFLHFAAGQQARRVDW